MAHTSVIRLIANAMGQTLVGFPIGSSNSIINSFETHDSQCILDCSYVTMFARIARVSFSLDLVKISWYI